MKFGAIVQNMSLTESLEFLGINDKPYFYLDSITQDLCWLHDNGVKIHLQFDTIDYRKSSFYFHEFDFDFYSHPFCEWPKAQLYGISQSYFDAIESDTLPDFVQIQLDVSMDRTDVEMMIRKTGHHSHHLRYNHCINCEDDYCNICNKHPNNCIFCEDCGECLGAACACDRAIDLEMRDLEESDEKKDKQRFKQIKKRMKYEADLDDYIERKYDRAQVGVDAD
ncbi:putative orfan [Tupanvirus soda lake]|uniref:Orfan n=2 Tax=Tupanvirus TaxID=2094720 RepID=A0AC62ADK5_9VIRU|nr:putative orfan [Tupanvirus soda lake]QKU35730.1 putative orfan [Tupanvirus soda lake]